ncbi:hypothetical protein F5J12DRAFT_907508 [Pisolithus orientalis]|uniref:uncharacterized protein n=1 Tax=Pisolithus orientalis TaxID=936130 RepID=UPI0022241B29|nr:uncharacterized protein F5J12DRAFT_907508 [Pisolithus orientalis]KAI5991309.1 hypothetical protein F5J12DRAFT_907508 [Pisolithus orientalis]
MASQVRQPPPRLSIPPSLGMQQPFDGRQAMFSPGLPTSLQQSYHPPLPFSIGHPPLQTPMQPFFQPQPPNAPGRPAYALHKAHASMVHYPGFPPPTAIPITPLGQGFPSHIHGTIFRIRRQPSVSIGGPPKAPLGGPGRKHSPMAIQPPPPTMQKGKKIVVNLPVETIPGTNGDPPSRPSWARTPMPTTSTEEPFAWDTLKQRLIEERLEKLGVERGSGGSLPIHAPHARAASISSPADPSLLYFKLNELRRSQNASTSNSLSSSPQPPPMAHPAYFNPSAAFNPFGPSAVLGSDSIEPDTPFGSTHFDGLHAPQGRMPVTLLPLTAGISRGSSRPDFVRGFGLDIPEEEEPQEETPGVDQKPSLKWSQDMVAPMRNSSTHHSRHVSRLSHTLSLRSVGGVRNGVTPDEVDIVPVRSPVGNPGIDDLDKEAVGEWTGSEDLRMDESDDEQSIGEWSNPSDEERARHERMQRRSLRQRRQEIETPRRLPNFPAPPTGVFGVSLRGDYDFVSNPRSRFLVVDPLDSALRPSSTSTPGRTSGQFTIHDPALAHSRVGSDHFQVDYAFGPPAAASGSLNPHAKPFVFGSSRGSNSWSVDGAAPPPAPTLGHARLPSLGKPLNASAQEFKPTGFTFRPPPGVPQLPFPPQEPTTRPLPLPPVRSSSTRAQQGREKRQRRGSLTTTDDGNDSGKENMASFRFPAIGETPRSVRRSAPPSPRAGSQDFHTPLQPLTFSGFPTLPSQGVDNGAENDENLPGIEVEGLENDDISETSALRAAAPPKSRRAPIPLDFKNSSATNTVPAGVFKALVGDEKTRRTVRSRLSSRDALEHSQRPSLDDFSVPPIASQNRSRARLVTDPGIKVETESPDIFTPAIKRRSSLPALHSTHNSSLSNVSIPAINLTKRLEAQALEDKLEAILEEKFSALRSELAKNRERNSGASIKSAARGLDDSQIDARGELDLELIRDVVQQGHAENLLLIQTELRSQSLHQGNVDVAPIIEQINHRSLQVILNTLGQLSGKLDMHSFVEEIMTALTPRLNALRQEPVDYHLLTAQLSEAVKPNIEQLIDLAADKRETAGLIVNSILPLLPNSAQSPVDTESVIAEITAEVRRIIAPVDAHEIKEQVADLVVERLDSRLAVRDRAFNVDAVATKVTEGVTSLLHSVNDSIPKLDKLLELQSTLSAKNDEFVAKQDAVASLVSGVPAQLEVLQRGVATAGGIVPQEGSGSGNEEIVATLRRLESAIENVAAGLASGNQQYDILVAHQKSLHQELGDRINILPESLTAAVQALQTAHAEFAVSRETAKHDADEIRKLRTANSDLQIQLAKARGAHGQVRVEKDNLGERLKDIENERECLRAQVEELQASIRNQQTETTAIELRNSELEEALSQSLARLKASDVATHTQQERIAEVEKANRDAVAEQASLKSQVDDLQLQLRLATHEKELTAQSLKLLQQEHEQSLAQQNHWDDLRRNIEQIEALANAMRQADNEESKDLRRIRDQNRQLESEHAALQKRLREQEQKATNNERVANTAKQSLVQAQQRAAEWERRAKEYESDLELTQNRLDQAEQTKDQLDADYSLAKLQLEEKEAEDRLVKDREHKLREQVAMLEAQVARLEVDLSKARNHNRVNVPKHTPYAEKAPIPSQDASPPPRPDSRASTIYTDRSRTPVGRDDRQPRSDTPPQASVWDSMHAPRQRYPRLGPERATYTPLARSTRSSFRQSVASPTPSTVSLTPSKHSDGWYF